MTGERGRVAFEVRDDRVDVALAGDIDYAVVDTVSDEDLAEYGATRPMVVHMGEVGFMDSLGLSLLLRIRNHASRGVTLVDVGSEVRTLLELTGLTDAFVLADGPGTNGTDPVRRAPGRRPVDQ